MRAMEFVTKSHQMTCNFCAFFVSSILISTAVWAQRSMQLLLTLCMCVVEPNHSIYEMFLIKRLRKCSATMYIRFVRANNMYNGRCQAFKYYVFLYSHKFKMTFHCTNAEKNCWIFDKKKNKYYCASASGHANFQWKWNKNKRQPHHHRVHSNRLILT